MQAFLGMGRTRRRLLHFSAAACALLGAAFTAPLGAAPAAARPPPVVAVVGDSLSAEFGLARGSGWVSLLAQRLAARPSGASVLNASISGDTTAGGLARLPALLKEAHPAIVVIELGGNDALRGTPIPEVRRNLDAMAARAAAAGAKVLILGIQVPPNYGRRYNDEFAQMYAAVAAAHDAALVPFMLKGVADRPDARDWFQADGIHPIAKAHPLILDNVWPALEPLLKR